MKLEPDVAQRARAFVQETILPLLKEIGAEPAYERPELQRGDLTFHVNTRDGWAIGDTWFWRPLVVLYRDHTETEDAAFAFRCRGTPDVRLTRATVAGVFDLQDDGDGVAWFNPLDGKRLFRFRRDDPHKVLVNAWYLFRSAVLPMLYQRTYRFSRDATEAVVFQQLALRQLRGVWENDE